MERTGAARLALQAGMLAGLGYLIAQTSWLVIGGPEPPINAPAALSSSGTGIELPSPLTEPDNALSKTEIQGWGLFGVYPASLTNTGGQAAPPPTSLQFTLLGLFYDRSGDNGWAIIQTTDNGQTQLYRPGDELTQGVTLNQLAVDHVLLKRQGHLEKLPLLAWEAIRGIARAAPGEEETDGEKIVKQLNDREKAMKRLGVEPVTPGAANGYRVVDENGEIAKSFGFRKGDIFLSVNGYPLGTRTANILAKKSVTKSGVGNIIILRDEKQFLIEYHTRSGSFRNPDGLVVKNERKPKSD